MATHTAPGLLRPPPALVRWPDTDASLWPRLTAEAEALLQPEAPRAILANDMEGSALTLARRSARAAGLAPGVITFTEGDAQTYEPTAAPDLVVTNPPWDVRLEGGEGAWRALSHFLRRECGGARAWVLSGNKDLTKHLRMRATSRTRIENAGSTLALIAYDVLRPRAHSDVVNNAVEDAVNDAVNDSVGEDAAPPAERLAAIALQDLPSGGLSSDSIKSLSSQATPAQVPRAENYGAEGRAAHASASDGESALTAGAVQQMTVAQLQQALRTRGLKVSGLKAALVTRLLDDLGTPYRAVVLPHEAPTGSTIEGGAAPPSAPKRSKRPARTGNADVVTLADATGKDGDDLENVFANLYG